MFVLFVSAGRKLHLTIVSVITHWSAGSLKWEARTMTAANVATQFHLRTDLTFISYVHRDILCDAADIPRKRAE